MPTPEAKGFKDRLTGTVYAVNDETAREEAAKAVQFEAQSLTDEQQAQARENIGAVSQAELEEAISENIDGSLATSGKAADAKATGDAIADVQDALDENLLDNTYIVNPENWCDESAVTDGILKADGTTESSDTKCYTDYIPVELTSKIRLYRMDNKTTQYRDNIACYDANKNVLPSSGSNSQGQAAYVIANLTDAQNIRYVRITFSKSFLQYKLQIVRDDNGTAPAAYSVYFAPFTALSKDYLTLESKAAVDKIKNKTLSTTDLAGNHAIMLPKGKILRQTVGLPQKWYYSNCAFPFYDFVRITSNNTNSTMKKKATEFLNTTAVSAESGFIWQVFDMLYNKVAQEVGTQGFGRACHYTEESLSNCTALVIGDSTVDQGDTMTQNMLDYFTSKSKTLTLLGTLGSGSNKNEGRAGWKATTYLTDMQYEGVTNPFYNPASETFDFSYYMTNQSYEDVDFVVLQLGINDLYSVGTDADSDELANTTWTAIKTMIDSILEFDSGIKIILNLPTAPNSDQGEHSAFLPAYQCRRAKYIEYALKKSAELYTDSSVRCSYCHLILDPDTDINDGVHPTNGGYEKMAMEVINQINCWQNNA